VGHRAAAPGGCGRAMRRKVVVTVSAMIVAAQLGSPVGAAQPTVEQLGEIAGYLEGNDVDGLRDYLDTNPDLAEGDTTLARLLRRFLSESADVPTYLGFQPDLSDAFQDLQDNSAQVGPDEPGEPTY
jgi:hypothetical protein